MIVLSFSKYFSVSCSVSLLFGCECVSLSGLVSFDQYRVNFPWPYIWSAIMERLVLHVAPHIIEESNMGKPYHNGVEKSCGIAF